MILLKMPGMIIQEYNGQLTQVILKNVETFFPHTRIRYKTNTMAFTTEQYQKIKDGKIKTAILNDGSKARIFLSQGGYICQFRKGSSRRGFQLSEHNIKEPTWHPLELLNSCRFSFEIRNQTEANK